MKLSTTTGRQGSRSDPIETAYSVDSDNAHESDSTEYQESEEEDDADRSSNGEQGSGQEAASEQSAERSCSKYKGISYNKKGKRFIAQLRGYIGCYKSLMEAVRAYNEKARKLRIKEHVVSSEDVNEVRSQIKATRKSRTLRRKKRRSCEYKKAYFHSDDESEGHSQSEATRKSRRPQRRKRGSSSKYKGVCFHKQQKRFEAYIHYNAKKFHLGIYDSEKDAARAYNQEARRLGRKEIVISGDDESDGRSQSGATRKSRRPQRRKRSSSSKYKGMTLNKGVVNRYEARIYHSAKEFYLGIYDSEKDAARAYNQEARRLGKKENVISSDDESDGRSQSEATRKFRRPQRRKRCSSSKYKGVSFHKQQKGFIARICHNTNNFHLGYYDSEKDAARAYNQEARRVGKKENVISSDDESDGRSQSEATRKFRRPQRKKRGFSSKYKGVYFEKQKKRFKAQISHNAKQFHLGYYDSEKDAARAYNQEARKIGRKENVISSDDESEIRCQSKATLKSRRPQRRNCGSPNNKCRDRNKEAREHGKEDHFIGGIASSSDDDVKVGSGLRSSTSKSSPRQNNFQEEMKSSNRAAIHDNNDNNEEDGNDSSGNSVIINNNTVSSFSKSERKVNAQRINITRDDGVQHRTCRNEPHESSNPLPNPNALHPSNTVVDHVTCEDFHLSFMPPQRDSVFEDVEELHDDAKDAGTTEFQNDLEIRDKVDFSIASQRHGLRGLKLHLKNRLIESCGSTKNLLDEPESAGSVAVGDSCCTDEMPTNIPELNKQDLVGWPSSGYLNELRELGKLAEIHVKSKRRKKSCDESFTVVAARKDPEK
eukprot:jgi/Bigna1/76115/fgenesh1_pg.39_\